MLTVQNVCGFLDEFAPRRLAAEWDNVGLLVGDRDAKVAKIMTCLTITPASAAEAIEEKANLIVSHHPLPFRPLTRLTTDTTAGRLLLSLIGAGIAIHSPHTGFDSAATGINQRLAEGLGLQNIKPLELIDDDPEGLGAGRFGSFSAPMPLGDVADRLKQFLSIDQLKAVGSPDAEVRRAAVACGSAGQFMDAARHVGCELLVTGETSFHTCLDAEATGTALLLTGHYASERFAVEQLADVLAAEFTEAAVWPSRRESDPLRAM